MPRSLPLLVTLALATSASAQQMKLTAGSGEVIGVALGQFVVLAGDSGGVLIDNVIADSGATSTRIGLERGDRIATLQGVPAGALNDFLARYRAIATGTEVLLGVTRAGAAIAVRFPKPPPQPRMMAVGGGPAGAPMGAWSRAESGGGNQSVTIAGVHIAENAEGMPEVTHRTSDPAGADIALRAGDVIIALGDKPIAALAGLRMHYDRVAAGAPVSLTVRRGAQQLTITFPKPDPQ